MMTEEEFLQTLAEHGEYKRDKSPQSERERRHADCRFIKATNNFLEICEHCSSIEDLSDMIDEYFDIGKFDSVEYEFIMKKGIQIMRFSGYYDKFV